MDFEYKIVILGNHGVGKTSFYSQLFYSRFAEQVEPTVAIDFTCKNEYVGTKGC